MEKVKYVPGRDGHDDWVKAHAKWLSGVFEIGGYVSFTACMKRATNGLYYPQSGPILGLQNEDRGKVEHFSLLVGGSAFPKEDPNRWQLSGKRAGWMLLELSPFMPSYRDILAEVESWMNTSDPRRAYEIAIAAQGLERNYTVPASFYRRLIIDPEFCGGITAFRGQTGTRLEDNEVISPRVGFSSNNLGITEAIKKRFGGSRQIREAGETVEIDGRLGRQRRDVAELSLVGNDARFWLNFVKRDTILRDEEMEKILGLAA